MKNGFQKHYLDSNDYADLEKTASIIRKGMHTAGLFGAGLIAKNFPIIVDELKKHGEEYLADFINRVNKT